MDNIKKGWFSELNQLWPGQAMSLEVEQVLHHEKSKYQDILVLQSKTYGRVLVLDGIIQCTDRDEFAYQEMIAHIPLFSHPNPKNVLVVGGGDGGVLREIAKHSAVEEIHLCEIDERVIALSKEFLPNMSVGFSNPKVQVHIQDGAIFMEEHKSQFDVIITDSSDPIGPAKCLFEMAYYKKMKESLKPDGIICTQGECLWLDLGLIKDVMTGCRSLFPTVSYAFTTIPTYPSGQIGFIVATLEESADLSDPVRKLSPAQVDEMGLQYYNSDVHSAAFVLPQFAKKVIII